MYERVDWLYEGKPVFIRKGEKVIPAKCTAIECRGDCCRVVNEDLGIDQFCWLDELVQEVTTNA